MRVHMRPFFSFWGAVYVWSLGTFSSYVCETDHSTPLEDHLFSIQRRVLMRLVRYGDIVAVAAAGAAPGVPGADQPLNKRFGVGTQSMFARRRRGETRPSAPTLEDVLSLWHGIAIREAAIVV